jgi:class 3 adenylate cyclase
MGASETVAEKIPKSPLQAIQSDSDLAEDAKKTTHVIFRSFDNEKRGLDILHKDLFDASDQVVLSALGALSAVKDPRSLKFIARLLSNDEEIVQCAAVKALGDIAHPKTLKVLLDMFKISKSENLRLHILEALSKINPQEPGTVAWIEEYAKSQLVKSETRVAATSLLLRLRNGTGASEVLSTAKEEMIEAVYTLAGENEQVAMQAVQHGASHYHRLSAANRKRLLPLVSSCGVPGAVDVFLEALKDVDQEVRRGAYQVLGVCHAQGASFSALAQQIGEQVDPDPNLEEEALAGIQRMEKVMAGRVTLNPETKKRIYNQIQERYRELSEPGRRAGSDSHELGWIISRSKEYLEYYADEDFRQALLHYLKGSGYYTKDRVLAELKSSAVKVEVRHFDGYRALVDIIQNPKRSGIGLITRELAIAKLGKRKPFYQLIRNLHLTRLFDSPGLDPDAARLFLQIFSWAKRAKLFRLADAALFALAKADAQNASDVARECLAPPVFSKICAISAIRLLRELDWKTMEPMVLKLISSSEDPHILLNLLDALINTDLPVSGEIVKSMVNILRNGNDQEVNRRTADFLGAQSVSNVFESVIEGFERFESWRQALVLSVLERTIIERRVSNQEGLIEFLYKILRAEAGENQSKAAVLLWRLGDEYAIKVLKGFLLNREPEEKIQILNSLRGALSAEIVLFLLPLLRSEHSGIHESLRQTLLSVEEEETQRRICELALSARGESGTDNHFQEELDDTPVQVDFLKERKAYRFEREYIQELAILFTDIQGYSKKAQRLSTLELSTLIQEYEGILLPTISNHRGELIKKMGDGHLCVFHNALHAVLAAIRTQKALKRFNSFREESQRIIIRIGIHWGKVVRKEGDVLGNHVNIASRLESSANGGSILISKALQQFLDDHIHMREIGLLKVKGISEPIKVYEPYEIVVDFPAELDPLNKKQAHAKEIQTVETEGLQKNPENGNGDANRSAVVLKAGTLKYIASCFFSLNDLCQKAESKQVQVADIRRELARRWLKLKDLLKEGGQS